MAKIQSVLVIGGTGFIGAPLVAELIRRGVERVSVSHTEPLTSAAPSSALYYRVDAGSSDIDALVASHDAIALLIQPNEAVTKNILKSIAKHGGKHLLYTSTTLLYRGGGEAQKENAPLQAVTAYEKLKMREEKLIAGAAHGTTRITIARLGNVYGDVRNKGVLGHAFRALFTGGSLEVRGGSRVRDYIFVDDVVLALATLVLSPSAKALEYINVSTGVGTTTDQLLSTLEKVVGKSLSRTEGNAGIDTESIIADNAKLVKRVGMPAHDVKKGLKRMHERFRAWYDFSTTNV